MTDPFIFEACYKASTNNAWVRSPEMGSVT